MPQKQIGFRFTFHWVFNIDPIWKSEEICQRAPGPSLLISNRDLIKNLNETAQGVPGTFSIDFWWWFKPEVWRKLLNELQAPYPLISNRDLLRSSELNCPGSSWPSYHWLLIKISSGNLQATALGAPDCLGSSDRELMMTIWRSLNYKPSTGQLSSLQLWGDASWFAIHLCNNPPHGKAVPVIDRQWLRICQSSCFHWWQCWLSITVLLQIHGQRKLGQFRVLWWQCWLSSTVLWQFHGQQTLGRFRILWCPY